MQMESPVTVSTSDPTPSLGSEVLTLAVDALETYRLTRLATTDVISEKARLSILRRVGVVHLLAERDRLTRVYELRSGRPEVVGLAPPRSPGSSAATCPFHAHPADRAGRPFRDCLGRRAERFCSGSGRSLGGRRRRRARRRVGCRLPRCTLGFFQATSSRGADRRLALAGAGPVRVAASRTGASLVLAAVAAAAGFIALLLRTGLAHPWHAAAAVLSFALIYLGVGVLIGSVISAPLEGSLAVAFVFLLDVFAGPGMASHAAFYSVSRKAADVLITAGLGHGSPAADWVKLSAVVLTALFCSFAAFVYSARSRA